jgi:AcrR family transcriptional regulator
MSAEDRRRQILDATLRVVARDGYSGLTMDVIAKEAGVTRTPLYAIFGDLPTLLRATVDEGEARALAAIPEEAIVDPPPDATPAQTLSVATRMFLDAVQADPVTWRVLLLTPTGQPEMVRRRYAGRRAEILGRVELMVRQVAGRRLLPDEVDPHVLARLIVAVGEDLGRMVLAEPGRWPPERVAAAIRDIVALMPLENPAT